MRHAGPHTRRRTFFCFSSDDYRQAGVVVMEKQANSFAFAMNAVFTDSVSGRKRWKDQNGFLHISLRFMRPGILKYAPTPANFPNGVPPEAIGNDGMVSVLVEPKELKEQESISSLAGMPCLREHDKAEPGKKLDIVGSVSGAPEYESDHVTGEAVIMDAETISRLEAGDLVEVSAGYTHQLVWEQGEKDGEPYSAKQTNIRYNHFVLLPPGTGRAGETVCVTNSKEKCAMSEKVSFWSKIYNRIIYAENEDDAKKLAATEKELSDEDKRANEKERELKATEKELSNEDKENGRLKKEKANNEGEPERAAHEEKEVKTADDYLRIIDQLQAQLDEMRSRLKEGRGEDELEVEIERRAAERDEAINVMESNGVPRQQAMNSIKEKKLHGHNLRVFAMNSIREARKQPLLSEAEIKNPDIVSGRWEAVKETTSPKKHMLAGAEFTRPPGMAMNSADSNKAYVNDALYTLGFREKKG